eukprot:TRINITY_DN7790_c0_g1_i1.p1 TRINITY_DN7790_c0_g1~~TRINITY_DN7790_c0_g1_i1.p1  ORF type:complete len:173 (-),score=45.58 TRINITY_DN7790_c0_g1_i1:157-675(-)
MGIIIKIPPMKFTWILLLAFSVMAQDRMIQIAEGFIDGFKIQQAIDSSKACLDYDSISLWKEAVAGIEKVGNLKDKKQVVKASVMVVRVMMTMFENLYRCAEEDLLNLVDTIKSWQERITQMKDKVMIEHLEVGKDMKQIEINWNKGKFQDVGKNAGKLLRHLMFGDAISNN